MFERLLAFRYIKAQKRHSIFTLCSIAVALALMTLLFVGFSTYKGVRRDAAYAEKPYHFKLMQLTDAEVSQLESNPDFISCKRVEEADGTLSAEILLKTYHDDFGLYVNTLFPEKYIYSDLKEEFKEELIDVNYQLIYRDQLEFSSKYEAVRDFAVYFLFILFLALALRMMIDTAFEISAKERERQFGVLQCVGAAPGQIVRIITFEGLFLCIIGVPVGVLLGIGLCYAAFQAIQMSGIAETVFTPEIAAQVMHLHIDPLMIGIAALTGTVWVFLSAYQIGMRLIKMTPIEALNGKHTKVVKVGKHSLTGMLFGWKGKLAARNSRRQPKRFVITVVSLTLSIALFASFSVVLKQSLAAFEKTVDVLGLNYDMSIAVKTDQEDPLSYRTGLERIRESGYFELDEYSKFQLAYFSVDENNSYSCVLVYYPRELFDRLFEGTAPVSYDELTQAEAFLILEQKGTGTGTSERFDTLERLNAAVQSRTVVSDADYESMTAEEKEAVKEYLFNDPVTGETVLKYRYTTDYLPGLLQVAGSAVESTDEVVSKTYSKYQMNGNTMIFVGTLDSYENGAYTYAGKGSVVNDEGLDYVHVNLLDESRYEEAKRFIRQNADVMLLDTDFYGDLRTMRSVVEASKIGIAFLSILIGIIALVNMVNTISTGILNRRSELAALQCFGMTQGQLYGMMCIECLQYALTAGVLATAVLEGLMLAMMAFLKKVNLYDVFGEMLQFAEPIPRIWIAAAVAFVAALLASLIPLHRMQKESLTDQIRAVE